MPSVAVVRVRLVTLGLLALLALGALAGARVERAAAVNTELFLSEYIEGTSNNKALEIFNDTDSTVNLAAGAYDVLMCFNGNPVCTLDIDLTGSVADNDVYVLAQASANAAILAQADQTNGAGWFNGDDAVLLRKAGVVIDSIGVRGTDPGTEWGTGLTSTMDNTLRRKAGVTSGDPNDTDPFDPAAQWDGFATDTFDGLGFHVSGGDAAPLVTSTTPANGAVEVSESTDITVTFSEPVTAAAGWYAISCSVTGAHTAVESGGPQS
jgi:uncharacterized protein